MDKLNLNERERRFLACAFISLKSKPEVDWAKVARMNNLKTAKVARDAFLPIRKKLEAMQSGDDDDDDDADADDAAEEASTTKPAPAKRGRAAKRKPGADEAEEADSPKKKTKPAGKAPKGKAATAKSKKQASDDDDMGDNITVQAPKIDYEDDNDNPDDVDD